MKPLALLLSIASMLAIAILSVGLASTYASPSSFQTNSVSGNPSATTTAFADSGIGAAGTVAATTNPVAVAHPVSSRSLVLVGSLTVFVLSIFIGFEIIAKVPPTLHTPLMSGSNAISGITVIGAIIASGYRETGIGTLVGLVAVVLAMINVVGGFVVTHRMLLMFKKR